MLFAYIPRIENLILPKMADEIGFSFSMLSCYTMWHIHDEKLSRPPFSQIKIFNSRIYANNI